MSLKITKPLVSVDWLFRNLDAKNLIILDATIPKVTSVSNVTNEKKRIKNAIFFDLKKTFADTSSKFPNTVLSSKEFEIKAKELGINKDSCLVVYDDLGIYSSPRVWWLFNLMGFKNIAVLDGGLPEWQNKKYPIENPSERKLQKGNFIVNYKSKKIKFTKDILSIINDSSIIIADARSKDRFYAVVKEPREEIRNGHIPNSISLPFTELQESGKIKSEENLKHIFLQINPKQKELIFSCGTGITACILALAAEIAGHKNYAIYDGSWTEWGSTTNLPISK